MYTLDIFKESNIKYSWATIFVGRRLGLLQLQEVFRYALEYLEDNSECKDIYITELACGVSENEVDEILLKVFKNNGYAIIEQDSPDWNFEKRKWRYCILRYLAKKYHDNPETFLREYDIVWAEFDHPIDMEKHLSFYVTDDGSEGHFDSVEAYYRYRMARILKTIIEAEKNKIENQDKSSF